MYRYKQCYQNEKENYFQFFFSILGIEIFEITVR